jgi:uncharacterized repeat protein (TIGR01451 family)/fimbrial isopeptide formation D2 family protein
MTHTLSYWQFVNWLKRTKKSFFLHKLKTLLNIIIIFFIFKIDVFSQVSLQKVPQVRTALPGVPFIYDIYYATPDLGALHNYSNIKITDTLPTWVTYIGSTGGGGFNQGVYNAADRTITWTASVLSDGATGALSLEVQFDNTAPPDALFSNQLNFYDNGTARAATTALDVRVKENGVTFTKTLFSGGTVGEDCVYKIVTTNNGYLSQATNYVVTDQMPPNALFVSATNSGGAVMAGVTADSLGLVSFPPVTITPGTSLTYYMRVRYPTSAFAAGTVVKNKGYGTGQFGNKILEVKDSATHTLTPRTCAVAYTASADPGTWYVNDTFSTKKYTFALSNTGTSALTNVVLSDTLPVEFHATGLKFGYNNSATPAEPLTVSYQLNGSGAWLPFPGSPFTAGQTIPNLANTLGLTATDFLSAIRYEWANIVPGAAFLPTNFYVQGKIISPMPNGDTIVTPGQVCNKHYLQYTDCFDSLRAKLGNACNPLEMANIAYTVDKRASSTEWRVTQTDAQYDFVVKNTGNVPLDSVIITDTLPLMFRLTSINLASAIAQAAKPVSVLYQKNGTGGWMTWTGSPFSAAATLNVSTLGIAAPNYVSAIQVNIGILSVAANYNNKEILMTGTIVNPQNDGTLLSLPTTGKNVASFKSGGLSKTDTIVNDVVVPYALPTFAKTSTPTIVQPLDTIDYTILIGNQYITPLNDFSISDPISSDLEYLAGSAAVVCQSGNCYQTAPYTLNTTETANYNGTGGTLLRFAFDYGANDGLPQKSNGQGLKITYRAVVRAGAPTRTIPNDIWFDYKGDPNMLYKYTCIGNMIDTFDINKNGSTTDTLCKAATVNNSVVPFIPAVPVFVKSSSPSTVRPLDTLTYTILAYNTSRKLLNDFELIDALNPNLQYVANSAVAVCQSAYCYHATPYTFTATATPNYRGTDSTLLRFAFDYAPTDGMPEKTAGQGIKITFKAVLKRNVPGGTLIKNDLMFQYNGNPSMPYDFACTSKLVDAADMNQNNVMTDTLCRATTTQFTSAAPLPAKPGFSKTSTPSTVRPTDTLTYTIKVFNTASVPLNDFAMIDFLNPNLNYVMGSEVLSCQVGNCFKTNPFVFTPTIIPNYNGTGKTLLRFHFNYGADDGLPLKTAAEGLKLTFKTTVKTGVPAGTAIVNDLYFQYTGDAMMPYAFTCTGSPVDTADINQDGSRTDILCKAATVSNNVIRSVSLQSQKFVKGSLDSNYLVNGHTIPGGVVNYKLQIWNAGNVPVKEVKIADVLPYINDKKVLYNFERVNPGASEWRPVLAVPLSGIATNQVGVSVPYTVQYSPNKVPCLASLTASNAFPMPNQAGCQSGNFSAVAPTDLTTVQSLFMDFGNNFILNPQDTLTLYWEMLAPVSAQVNKLAWNAFAYVADYADGAVGGLQPSEPPPVSIIIDPSYLGSIGNYVWLDANANAVQDEPDSLGINGLRIELWTTGPDNVIGGGDDTLRQFTLTQTLNGKNGAYLFKELYSNNYYVKFPIGTILNNQGLILTLATNATGLNTDSDAQQSTGFSPVTRIDINGVGILKDNLTIDAGFKAAPPCPPKICLPVALRRN